MPPPIRPRARRIKVVLLLCGVTGAVLCWSWVLFHLSSSLPRSPSHYDYASPMSMAPIPSKFNTDKQNRNLSGSMRNDNVNVTGDNNKSPIQVNIGDEVPIHYLRRATESSNLNQPAPHTDLIYPLHAKSGTHHAYLYIGTPPQRQTLIVDTGSRLTAFPCRPHCPDCGTSHASPQFHLAASSSHTIVPCDQCKLSQSDFPLEEYFDGDGVGGNSGDGPGFSLRGAGDDSLKSEYQEAKNNRNLFPTSCVNNQCEINQRYTEGSSWKAFEVQDNVWLGLDEKASSEGEFEKYSAPFVFGCQVSEAGLFKTQYADGIMGLAMYTQTLPGMLHQHGSVPHPSFSLCLNQKGGHISLGGTGSTYNQQQDTTSSSRRHLAPMQFTPFAKENVWHYSVTVTSISVGPHVLPNSILQFVNDHKGTIVDSGTTDTFIHHKLAKVFISAWHKITGKRYNNWLQSYTYEEFKGLPVITFELDGGIQWDIQPEAYMEMSSLMSSAHHDVNATASNDPNSPWEGKRGFTSRVYVDEPQGVVLGSNAMMDKEIYFDIPNKRLGVARATCAY